MKITRFGHSAVLVESGQTRVLVDPGVFSVPDLWDLTGLAAIVVTHQHPDHLDLARVGDLIAANPGVQLLAEPQTATNLADWTPTSVDARYSIGELTLTGVGGQHAEILDTIPRVGNIGMLVSDPAGTTFFHPGDSYEYRPAGVDILAIPLAAPWAKMAETIDFVRAISPHTAFPIHDGVLADSGYGIYWMHVQNHGGVADLQQLGQSAPLVLG